MILNILHLDNELIWSAALLCPPPPVVSEPVAGLVSPCDTQSKALQDVSYPFSFPIFYIFLAIHCTFISNLSLLNIENAFQSNLSVNTKWHVSWLLLIQNEPSKLFLFVCSASTILIQTSRSASSTWTHCLSARKTLIPSCTLWFEVLAMIGLVAIVSLGF